MSRPLSYTNFSLHLASQPQGEYSASCAARDFSARRVTDVTTCIPTPISISPTSPHIDTSQPLHLLIINLLTFSSSRYRRGRRPLWIRQAPRNSLRQGVQGRFRLNVFSATELCCPIRCFPHPQRIASPPPRLNAIADDVRIESFVVVFRCSV